MKITLIAFILFVTIDKILLRLLNYYIINNTFKLYNTNSINS